LKQNLVDLEKTTGDFNFLLNLIVFLNFQF